MSEMLIKVGSQNPAKVEAVREILQEYSHLKDAKIEGVDVSSDISEQPLSLEETVRGAANRARNSFGDCSYSVGIESGLVAVPYTKSGYMDLCAAVIYDGTEVHVGLSSSFEFPDKEITRMIVEDGIDMAQAVNQAGLTSDPAIGSKQGAVGILTKGRVDRKEYTKQALRMALIHIDKHDA